MQEEAQLINNSSMKVNLKFNIYYFYLFVEIQFGIMLLIMFLRHLRSSKMNDLIEAFFYGRESWIIILKLPGSLNSFSRMM